MDIGCKSKYTTLREQALPSSPSLRPADLLVLGWKDGKPLALDFTVITPALNETPGSEIRVAASLLVLACAAKVRRYRAACERDGWSLQPFAADVFGALHPSARRIVHCGGSDFQVLFPFATLVWRALSTASVLRAAHQTMDFALHPTETGTLLQLLEEPVAKRPAQTTVAEAQGVNMGSITPFLPSSSEADPTTGLASLQTTSSTSTVCSVFSHGDASDDAIDVDADADDPVPMTTQT